MEKSILVLEALIKVFPFYVTVLTNEVQVFTIIELNCRLFGNN